MLKFFGPKIEKLETEYAELSLKQKENLETELTHSVEEELNATLDEPAEIWHDEKTFKEFPIFFFLRPLEDVEAIQIAAAYVSADDEPTFIFLHFLTNDMEMVEKYRRGELVYDKAYEEIGFAAIDGDALSEGDPFAMGLFISMLKLRSEQDVSKDRFLELGKELREETIESTDEIWRSTGLNGQNIVTFIKQYPEHEIKDLTYICITQEEGTSNVHTLLFSFPTNDEALVDRYRHGDNLQAEEVQQESSH